MIPVLLLLFSTYTHGAIIRDRLDYRKANLSSVPSSAEIEEEDQVNSITKIIFSHNAIEVLRESDFKSLHSFPNTKYLFLDNNKIWDIYDDGFSRLPNLQHLDLSHNELTTISDELRDDLRKLPSLKYINLKRNPIEDFGNVYKLIEAGVDIDFDGMSGVHTKRSSVMENDEANRIVKDRDNENITITDRPRKAFVRDNKRPVTDEKGQLDVKYRNSIVFNFVAAGLILIALPLGMVFYFLVNRNRQAYL